MRLVLMAICNLGLQEVSTSLVFVCVLTNRSLNSRCLFKGKSHRQFGYTCSKNLLVLHSQLKIILRQNFNDLFEGNQTTVLYLYLTHVFFLRTVFFPTRLPVYSFQKKIAVVQRNSEPGLYLYKSCRKLIKQIAARGFPEVSRSTKKMIGT